MTHEAAAQVVRDLIAIGQDKWTPDQLQFMMKDQKGKVWLANRAMEKDPGERTQWEEELVEWHIQKLEKRNSQRKELESALHKDLKAYTNGDLTGLAENFFNGYPVFYFQDHAHDKMLEIKMMLDKYDFGTFKDQKEKWQKGQWFHKQNLFSY